MVGYLYNNQLGMTDSAEAAYRKFLSLYPQNELATSAQFELETLGKDPQELLPPPEQRKVVTSRSKPKTASPR
jgi:predicted TPR repeat methyltransferase